MRDHDTGSKANGGRMSMNTPVYDFITKYAESKTPRLHMPGHKGKSYLGPEAFDITEIRGADELYEADGIIAESERNAANLFGSAVTAYSTEGSTQCIKAMLALAAKRTKGRPKFLAARNVHKAFIYGVAYLDAEVEWIFPEPSENGDPYNICRCTVTKEMLEKALSETEPPTAVYVTSPDYLGNMLDIRGLSEVAHRHGTLLLVDNAHGAYLHFLKEPCHPLDLGADMCSDSAHKTLPVLTGGAYLHISKNAPKELTENVKGTLEIFGSTSPSYLTLASLDLCNRYLAERATEEIDRAAKKLQETAEMLKKAGIKAEATDPLKLTLNRSSIDFEKADLSCFEPEFTDKDYIVMMFTADNSDEDFKAPLKAFKNAAKPQPAECLPDTVASVRPNTKMAIRESIMAGSEIINISYSIGRICAQPSVSCPPAVPIVMPGEEITEDAVALMRRYDIEKISVIKE